MESREATHHETAIHTENELEAGNGAVSVPKSPKEDETVVDQSIHGPPIETLTELESKSEGSDDNPNSWHDFFRDMHEDEHPSSDGEIEKLRAMLNGASKSKINNKDEKGQTALYITVERGLKKAAIQLLNAGAQTTVADNTNDHPLHIACYLGNLQLAKELLANNADIEAKGEHGETPLGLACRRGHTEVVELLLNHNASTHVWDLSERTPLFAAALQGHAGVVKHILEKDLSSLERVDGTNSWTALHVAIYKGHEEIVSMLLEAGSRLDVQARDGSTPLMTAIQNQREGIVKMLLVRRTENEDLQLETPSHNHVSPLGTACIRGFTACARLLIDAGADCTVRTLKWLTPVFALPCAYRNREIVLDMITRSKSRIDGNYSCNSGRNPLNMAAERGHTKIVELLLDHREAIGLSQDTISRALFNAIDSGCESMVRLLLGPKGGVSVNYITYWDQTPLHTACNPLGCITSDSNIWGPDDLSEEERSNPEFQPGRHEAILRLLLERGANVEAKTSRQSTVLHSATASGDVDTINLILERMRHVDILAKSDNNDTVLGTAFHPERQDAMRALLSSPRLETADFGTDKQQHEALSWAAVSPVRHDIAKLILAKMYIERPRPMESGVWSAIEWATFLELPQILWMLIASSPRSKQTTEVLERAMRVAATARSKSDLAAQQGARPEQETASVDKSEGNDGETNAGEQGQSDDQEALMDILRDPPTGLLYTGTGDQLKLKNGLKETLATCSKALTKPSNGFWWDKA
ncbi:hypothetical protein CDV36_013385 [Fusarium kuroshium]|uniref:Uncharacterized protein n=1 Tax=Fusarium kuroshium TaxID=2010991 RepID=A0A3M2RNZ3_9HYPO|nr:hypothetical protein CDV36_013385 [Fusarium kuroshium]